MPNSQQSTKQLLDRIEDLIDKQHFEALKSLLEETRTSDVAEVVEVVDEVARQILFDLLGPKEAGEVLEKIDEATRNEIVEDMTSNELGEIVSTLPPDEAADIMADFSQKRTEEVLDQMDDEESDQIEKLLCFDEETAGGIMTPVLLEINIKQTVRDAIQAFRQGDPDDDFYSVFVVDNNRKLKGVVSIQELLRYPRNTPIVNVMDTDSPTVPAEADQEEVANIFRKNDLIVMPVVDNNHILLGRITVDDVVDVMEEEAEEDVMVMAGTHPDEFDTRRSWQAAKVRLPWLLTCLTCAIISASFFQGIFRQHFMDIDWICILMFMPAIAAMGGNSGMQTSTVVVRGLATGDLAGLDIGQVFLREIRIASLVAMICGSVAGALAIGWLCVFPDVTLPSELAGANNSIDIVSAQTLAKIPVNHAIALGCSVGLSIFCCVILSTIIGLSLPFLFRKIGVDPAISSGPLVTTANDALSYVVYFSLAFLLLQKIS
ncbi:MAG: magnesium transporter [Phycisphaerae bacterium]|nr:magnesium transporter [Phycisphaerae bacterium]